MGLWRHRSHCLRSSAEPTRPAVYTSVRRNKETIMFSAFRFSSPLIWASTFCRLVLSSVLMARNKSGDPCLRSKAAQDQTHVDDFVACDLPCMHTLAQSVDGARTAMTEVRAGKQPVPTTLAWSFIRLQSPVHMITVTLACTSWSCSKIHSRQHCLVWPDKAKDNGHYLWPVSSRGSILWKR